MVDCPKESDRAAPGSPAAIADDEALVRVVPASFIDPTNGVDPGFYSKVFDDGMSTLRLRHLDEAQVQATLEAIFPGRIESELHDLCNAYVQADVADLKKTAHQHFPELAKGIDDRRVFCVHDTPILPLRPSHADVEVAPAWKPEPPTGLPISKTKIKKRLRDLFGSPKSLPVTAS